MVVTDSDSVALANRIPVRLALRRAEAELWADDCELCAACCAELRWPVNHSLELPLDDDEPPPPLSRMMEPPQLELLESVWKALPPAAASLKAELKVAWVEV
ncbi:MAG: hypothetical protein ACRDOE_27230, partial [Streptosporangiaceae bacterium]